MDGVNQGITVIVPLTARAIIVIVTPGPPCPVVTGSAHPGSWTALHEARHTMARIL